MPFQSHRLRRLAIASLLASVVFGAGASSAQAATKTLNYSCTYPIVGKKPVQIDVTTDIPAFAKLNEPQPAWNVDVATSAGSDASELLDVIDAYSLGGVAEGRASLVFPTGFVQGNLKVPLTVDKWTRTSPTAPLPNPFLQMAKGKTPSVNLDEIGKTDVRLDKFSFNLSAFHQDGTPIIVRPRYYEGDSEIPYTDSDGNVNTFDVYCSLAPGQSAVLATVCVNQTGLPDDTCDTFPDDVTPPSKVVLETPTITVCPKRTVTISWQPSTDVGSGVKEYRVSGTTARLLPASATSFTLDGDSLPGAFSIAVEAVDRAGNVSEAAVVSGTIPIADCDARPSKPGPGVYDVDKDIGETFLVVRWGASTDTDLKGYRIEYEGDRDTKFVDVPAGTTSYRFDGLGPDSEYYFHISAIDNAGNESEQSEEFLITRPRANQPPTPPTNLGTSTMTTTSITLTWAQSTDDRGIAGYNVYQDLVKVNAALLTKPIIPVDGLQPDTEYRFFVEAVDTDGATARSAQITARTGKAPVPPPTLNYALQGSTSLKTVTTGSLPLAGGIKATVNLSTGTFDADLTLNNTSGRLVAAGFLPLTAKVGFVPVGKTTGVLADSTATQPQSITTNSKVRIKVLEVKLFGAIPLAGGNSCQTKTLSDINLKSTGAFDPLKGGTIAGTYAISDLNGCGPLNGLVSPLTAGKGNTISLALTRQP